MFKKMIAIGLTVVVGAVCCSCSSGDSSSNNSASKQDITKSDAINEESVSSTENGAAPKINDSNLKLNSYEIEKLGSCKLSDTADIEEYESSAGLIYKNVDKYGIISNDGKHDTGAVYTYCEKSGSYYIVSKKGLTDVKDTKAVNVFGLVDENGNQLLEEKYCAISTHNDSFALATTATSVDKENVRTVAGYDGTGTKIINEFVSSSKVKYGGKNQLYSIKAKKFLNDSAIEKAVTDEDSFISNNTYFVITDSDIYDYNGKHIGSIAQSNYVSGFRESCITTNDGKVTVLNGKGDTVLTYDMYDGNNPYGSGIDAYSCDTPDGYAEYVSLDNEDTKMYDIYDLSTGKVVASLSDELNVYKINGKLISTDNGVYSLDTGKLVDGVSADFEIKKYDAVLNNGYMLLRDNDDGSNDYMYLSSDNQVVYCANDKKYPAADNLNMSYTAYISDEFCTYSYGNKKYIKGTSFNPFLIEDLNALYDGTNGECLIRNANVCRIADFGNFYIVTDADDTNKTYTRYKLTKAEKSDS